MPRQLSLEEELRRLQEFTDQIQNLLEVIVTYPHYIVPGRHHELLTEAWGEVFQEFEQLHARLTPSSAEDLKRVGLTGSRLLFELSVFGHARERLLDYAPELFGLSWGLSEYRPNASLPTQVPIPLVSAKKRKWWQRLGSRLLRCLKAGDVVLGSLAVAFPPAEIINQFKEGVEEGISLARDLSDS